METNQQIIMNNLEMIQELDAKIRSLEETKETILASTSELLGDANPTEFKNDNGGFGLYKKYNWVFSEKVQALKQEEKKIQLKRKSIEAVEKLEQRDTVEVVQRLIYKNK